MLKEVSIKKYDSEVQDAIHELWETAFENQKNENDLLLILINGATNNYSQETLSSHGITKYQIGHDYVYFRYNNFFDFFNQFKKVINEEELDAHDDKQQYVETMIQMQLLSYLKFWEADLILKRLLNLSRLAQGLEFSWEITQVRLDSRRKLIKEEIQKPLETICPMFFGLIEDLYSRQLRNAIAHSQYYILYDSINLTNREQCSYYLLNSITFERWDEIFTKIILFHNHMIKNFNYYHQLYVVKVEKKQNGLIVQFPEKMPNGLNKTGWLTFDKELNRWIWNSIV